MYCEHLNMKIFFIWPEAMLDRTTNKTLFPGLTEVDRSFKRERSNILPYPSTWTTVCNHSIHTHALQTGWHQLASSGGRGKRWVEDGVDFPKFKDIITSLRPDLNWRTVELQVYCNFSNKTTWHVLCPVHHEGSYQVIKSFATTSQILINCLWHIQLLRMGYLGGKLIFVSVVPYREPEVWEPNEVKMNQEGSN